MLRNIFPNYKAVESHDSPSKSDTEVLPEQKASSMFAVLEYVRSEQTLYCQS